MSDDAARELTQEMRRLRLAIERNEQKLVTAKRAAHLMEISAGQFCKEKPLTPIHIPGMKEPRYAVSEIEALAERWREAQ